MDTETFAIAELKMLQAKRVLWATALQLKVASFTVTPRRKDIKAVCNQRMMEKSELIALRHARLP
jgi:hypothetical protein